jgi:phosphoribosylformylglycinamidine cyclo-ligase
MSTYKDSGVNIETGDAASKAAYAAAKQTFASRQGMIGAPVIADDGYAGLIDMGDFYLVQNDDGVGTKSMVASQVGKYDTLGQDLLCMVVDDAICVGAEVFSVTNTMDVAKVEPEMTAQLMKGLQESAVEQKVALTGGEIAEVPGLAKGLIWNATAVGIVAKDRVLDGSKIEPGQKIVALQANGFRSNGLTLVRHILDNKIGPTWYEKQFPDGEQTWGEAVLTPCRIYHADLLELIGRYGQDSKVNITGISHITGGGLRGNLNRILGSHGAKINFDMSKVPAVMMGVMNLGQVEFEEALKTWNMGLAMLVVTTEPEKIIDAIEGAWEIGEVTDTGEIQVYK